MDVMKNFQINFSWCKPDWSIASWGEQANELLKQCAELPKLDLSDDVEEIIKRSKAFPEAFPIQSVRIEVLKARRPVDKLRKNIVSTYPIVHERVLLLMAQFLSYKREFGSSIEKEFYKNMSVPDLIDRILKKRALMFVGPHDRYKLLTGELHADGWEAVGTLHQKLPLLLENCLSYDEMKLSSMVYVSGHTECINNGNRFNKGIVKEDESEENAVIIGIVGPRFQRRNRMEYEDILITKEQNCLQNGYGEKEIHNRRLSSLLFLKWLLKVRDEQPSKRMWRQMWSEFYQVQNHTYEELTSTVNIPNKPTGHNCTDRYVKLHENIIFDSDVYYKRLSVIAECTLLDGEARAKEAGRDAFVNVIGAGLGVWKISSHQPDIYILTFMERIRALLTKNLLNHVSDVNFAYFDPSDSISTLFTSPDDEQSTGKRIFFKNNEHPKGGINVMADKREPSAKLTGEHEGKLLVITYPWDGNAHPGNEFWLGSLTSSGDPAAACSTQVSELHNAHVNPAVSGYNVRIVSHTGLHTLSEYCSLTA